MVKAKVKLADVAKAAGVSRAAAGKILNHCEGAIRVGEDARKRIIEAAAKLDYHNNLVAAALAGKKSSLIGVMIDSHSQFRRQQMLLEVENAATARNLRLLVSYTHDNIKQMEENLRAMDEYGVRGILCLSHDYYKFQTEVTRIFLNRSNVVFLEDPFFPGSCYVKTDDTESLRCWIADMKKSGITKIVCLHGNVKNYTERTLISQFTAAMTANALPILPETFYLMPDRMEPQIRAEYVIKEVLEAHPVQAVFSDDATYVVCILNQLMAKRSPLLSKIIFFGGNNDPLFSFLSPAVNSLDPDYSAIAEAMLDALDNDCKPGCAGVIPSLYYASEDKKRKVQISCGM